MLLMCLVMTRYTHSTSADEYARFLQGLLFDCCDTTREPMAFLGLEKTIGEEHRSRRAASQDDELAHNGRGAGTPTQASTGTDVRHANAPYRYSRSSTRVLARQLSQRAFATAHGQSQLIKYWCRPLACCKYSATEMLLGTSPTSAEAAHGRAFSDISMAGRSPRLRAYFSVRPSIGLEP